MRNKNQRRHARLRRRGRYVHCTATNRRAHWGKFGAAGVLIMCDGYVLLSQRSFSLESHRGQWSLPGGALDARWEQPIAGAMRELFEEVSGINVFDLHRIAEDSVGCSCGWEYTTFRLQADYLFDCYIHDWETRRLAWVPISMVENMNLLASFRRYWKSHSKMIAAESPFVNHSDDFSEQRYDYDLDEHYSQSYYDKKGESRFERKYTSSYTSYSYGGYGYYPAGSYSTSTKEMTKDSDGTYKTTGKYGTDYPGYTAWGGYGEGYYGDGAYVGGGNSPEFREPNYGNRAWGNSYTSRATQNRYNADNGFHHQPSLDEEWDVEPTDDELEGAAAAVDLDNLIDADWETINDSVLDAIDKAMVHVGVD